MRVKISELGGGRPLSLPGHPGWWDGGGHWVIRVLCLFLIESKPPVFQLSLPPKQTFSGWLTLRLSGFQLDPHSLSVGKTFSSHTEVFLQFNFKVAKPRSLERKFQSVCRRLITTWEGGGGLGQRNTSLQSSSELA